METESPKLEEYRAKMAEFEKARREVERVRQDVIAGLLKQRKEVTQQLRQLGYEGDGLPTQRPPRFVPPDSAQASIEEQVSSDGGDPFRPLFRTDGEGGPRRKRLTRPRDEPVRHCPVCEVDGHDLRAHRGQAHKRPFSASERKERGLPETLG